MTVAITPISKLEQELAQASTPKESKRVEEKAAAEKAHAKEQGDFEKVFHYALVYIRARCKTTELIKPTIRQGGDGSNQYGSKPNDTVRLADYGFTEMQWNRRSKELKAFSQFDEYQDDCVEKSVTPTPFGLVGYFGGSRNANNSGNDEWHTPPRIIEKARAVMGGIDLDPASSDKANKIVKARTYYTIENDGLSQPWFGRVWMNPPYSQPIIGKFCKTLTDELVGGKVTEAIVLVNNATETSWFQNLLDFSNAVCFIKGRVKFIDEAGNPSGMPLQGQAMLYFGSKSNGEKFTDEFLYIGKVLWNAER